MNRPRRIVHIINSLEFGGAEAMLCDLVLRHDRNQWEPTVVTLIDNMSVAQPLIDAGVPILCMNMRPGFPDPRGVLRLARALKKLAPDLVQTWMDHSNLIGGVVTRMVSKTPVVWGIHHADHVREKTKKSTLMTVAACARFSRTVPKQIVSCSHHGRKLYAARGFDEGRMQVIPNGFDLTRFRMIADAPERLRKDLGLKSDAMFVGMAARFDPLKDHHTFVQAALKIAERIPSAQFVMCGTRIDRSNRELAELLQSTGMASRFHLLGPIRDMPAFYSAMDLVVSSSISEAFPLVLGEAMACGTVCVATDVGDSALILKGVGEIAPPGDPASLASACVEVLRRDVHTRHQMGLTARQSVAERFGLDAVTRQYERLYSRVLDDREVLPIATERFPCDAELDIPLIQKDEVNPWPPTSEIDICSSGSQNSRMSEWMR